VNEHEKYYQLTSREQKVLKDLPLVEQLRRINLCKIYNLSATFEDIYPSKRRDTVFERFVAGKGLHVNGPVGVGKTFALQAYLRACALAGQPVMAITAGGLLNKLRQICYDKTGPQLGLITALQGYLGLPLRKGVLLIDDYGASKQSEFSIEVWPAILDTIRDFDITLLVTTNMQGETPEIERDISRMISVCQGSEEWSDNDRRLKRQHPAPCAIHWTNTLPHAIHDDWATIAAKERTDVVLVGPWSPGEILNFASNFSWACERVRKDDTPENVRDRMYFHTRPTTEKPYASCMTVRASSLYAAKQAPDNQPPTLVLHMLDGRPGTEALYYEEAVLESRYLIIDMDTAVPAQVIGDFINDRRSDSDARTIYTSIQYTDVREHMWRHILNPEREEHEIMLIRSP